MKPQRRLTNLLAACAVAAAALWQPAAASSLANDAFIKQNTDRRNFEPGGKYHLFGNARGSVAERSGQIHIIPTAQQTLLNNRMETAVIKGEIGYTTRFGNHGHEVHAPFDNHSHRSAKSSQGRFAIDRTTYSLQWTGHEHHPADGYDGPKGGGYPDPKGARDEYHYKIDGIASKISVIPPERIARVNYKIGDRIEYAEKSITQGLPAAWNKATTHNPGKDRVGNTAEVINAAFAGANHIIGAGMSLLGAGDVADAGLTALAIGNVEYAGTLNEDGQIAFVEKMIDNANKIDRLKSAYGSWKAAHPNAAEVAEAAVNIAGSVTGMKAVTAMKGAGHVRTRYDFTGIEANPIKRAQMGAIALPKRKAAISENFADAQQGRYGYNTPYHSRNIRTELEQRYGKGNITSSTVPPSNGKNVKLADKSHPRTGVPFDSKGFPNFEKYAKYDTRINTKEFRSKSSTGQMKLATKDLAEAIRKGQVRSSSFNAEQLKAIGKGQAKIPDYTWHHHQDTGRMQLVPEKLHHDTGHIGWEAMNNGR